MEPLRFITCGSVDDGKSTLIGRLLLDSRAILQDQLAGVQRAGQTDLALVTDGLVAEREQGITIDVAWRYFATPARKFIIGDAPGHEQYTRNMVTAASQADAAVVLIDATKINASARVPALLPQTRRHSLLTRLLRVPSIVFAVNKLDAVGDGARAFAHIGASLTAFAQAAGIEMSALLPISALHGHNVVDARPGWCGYNGPSLLQVLSQLPVALPQPQEPMALPVQWVERFSWSNQTDQGRRIFWGRIAQGTARAGDTVRVLSSGLSARIAQVIDHTRQPGAVGAGWSAGLVLDREIDASRGDWLMQETAAATLARSRSATATLAWMDDEPLVPARSYWALHGHRWVKAQVSRIHHQLDINSLSPVPASRLQANAIGQAELVFQDDLALRPFGQSRHLGSLILVDTASHRTAGAVLIDSLPSGRV
jgi:sulfate adenylyltransferase subunit 1